MYIITVFVQSARVSDDDELLIALRVCRERKRDCLMSRFMGENAGNYDPETLSDLLHKATDR